MTQKTESKKKKKSLSPDALQIGTINVFLTI